MANIVPMTEAAAKAASMWTGRTRDVVPQDGHGAVPTAGKRKRVHGMTHRAVYLSGMLNNQDYTAARGVFAVALQANTTGVRSVLSLEEPSGRSIRATVASGVVDGWLHMLIDNTITLTETEDEAPVAKGTAGHVENGWMFLNHASATPNTVTNGKTARTQGLRLQIYPFERVDASDVWLCTSSRLCPGVVAAAWQTSDASTAANNSVVTMNVDRDVLFSGGSAGGRGWLWVWRKR